MRNEIGFLSKFGAVRCFCLCIISFGLVIIVMEAIYEQKYKLISDECNFLSELSKISRLTKNLTSSTSSVNAPWDYNWDRKLATNNEASVLHSGERTMILVRHGQYNLSTGKLTDLGRQQADMTGLRLKQMNLSYDCITHSTMDRAVETAHIVRRHLESTIPIASDEMLIEGGPVPPNPTISYWKLPDRNYFLDGPRMEASFRKYFYRSDAMDRSSFKILVGHGNIFRFFALRALQLPSAAWMRVFIAHASITMLHIRSDGTVSMSRFGDCGHFPADKVTF